MKAVGRSVIMAEMHGRDLVRRHVAVLLLLLLPVSFFLASTKTVHGGIPSGGVSLAFSVGGATLFSALSSARVDQRLVLAGYRPSELVLGRLLFLGPLGIAMAVAFAGLMILVSDPADAGVVVAGVVLVAVQSVPLGLLIAYVVPRELEGTLVLIGVVGIQLAAPPSSVVGRLLPLHGAREVLQAGATGQGPVLVPLLVTLAYGLVMLGAAELLAAPRLSVTRRRRTVR